MPSTPPHFPSRRASAALLAAGILLAIAPQGCGEPPPPPLSKDQFEAAKEDREKIIIKEYGQKAFDKGSAPKK